MGKWSESCSRSPKRRCSREAAVVLTAGMTFTGRPVGCCFFWVFSSNSIQTDPNLHRCGFSIKKNMQLSLIIACNLHTAVSDVCTINNVQTSRTKNLSKNLVFGCIKVQRKSKKSARKLYGRGSPQCLVHICTRFWQEPGQRVKIGKC